MDSIILGILVALVVWIIIKKRQGTSGNGGLFGGLFKSSPTPVSPQPQPSPGKREISRIGRPGTITKDQLNALRRNYFDPSKKWSFEEAALILDAVIYLRAVWAEVVRKSQPSLDIQNELLTFIMTDQDLRNYVRKWGQDRRDAGIEDQKPELKQNKQFERVARMAKKLDEGHK